MLPEILVITDVSYCAIPAVLRIKPILVKAVYSFVSACSSLEGKSISVFLAFESLKINKISEMVKREWVKWIVK